jgi:hypothetical protein
LPSVIGTFGSSKQDIIQPKLLIKNNFIKNNSVVSIFAQTAGAGSPFNQSSLAEERRQAGWLPGP